jgi:transposase
MKAAAPKNGPFWNKKPDRTAWAGRIVPSKKEKIEMSRYVGIDIGLGTAHKAAVVDGAHRRGKAFTVEVSREGLEELLRRATEETEEAVKFVIEPTGLAWVPVAAYAKAAGHQVYMVKPQKTSDLRKFLKKHTKTDGIDAEANARVPQVDPEGVHELQLPVPEQMALQRLVKRRERLAGEVADQKRRVHALMVMVNPRLMPVLGDAAFSQAGRAFLRQYADPELVVKAGSEKLKKFWKKHSPGADVEERIERIVQACRTAVELYESLRQKQKLPFNYADVQEELQGELDWMEHAEQQVERLEQQIAVLYERWDPNHTLEQICGIGATIAPALDALLGNVLRFRNGRQVTSFSGLCPRKKQSGNSDPAMPITKSGHRLLKKYFYLAADVARQWDPEFAAYYARRWARGDHHNRILVALARKMVLRVYALLRRREQARQAGASQAAVSFLLRDPATGQTVDKKQARTLIVENYTRAAVAGERLKSNAANKKGTALAKKEWPSKDATSRNTMPVSEITQASQGGNSVVDVHAVYRQHQLPRGGGLISVADVVKLLLEKRLDGAVDFLGKSCGNSSLPSVEPTEKKS